MSLTTHKPIDKLHRAELEARVEDQAVEAYLAIRHALKECSDATREIVEELIAVLDDPESDRDDHDMAMATIREALFPVCYDGAPGLDLETLETEEAAADPRVAQVLAELDAQEAAFADRVRGLMAVKGLTQVALADAAGLNQPAISMLLSRRCRPQGRTVRKLAEALGVAPEELWPSSSR